MKKKNISVINKAKGGNENNVKGWWFSDNEILTANQNNQLLTLDMDIGSVCDLNCSFCFANTRVKQCDSYIDKTTKRAKQILIEAAKLGCKSIKIVGAGEPTLFPELITILEHCKRLDIIPIIFTAGHIIGDDRRARIHKKHGVLCGMDLAKKLYDLNCSIIIKHMTLNDKLNNQMVGAKFDHANLRDQGLINLIKAGFNQDVPTRLGVDCLLMKSNYEEALELFKFFNNLNIFCVLNTSMDCGATEMKLSNPDILTKDEALDVAIKLYTYCKNNNIPFDSRISPYFLSPVCSQLNHGLFIGDDNSVKVCPGGPVIGTYNNGNLKKIWNSNPFKKSCIGHKCISRCGKTYHADFEERVRLSINFS